MKTTLRVLAAALVVASASVAQAQGGGGGGGGNMQERMAQQRAMMFEGITLDAAQKTKIDSIQASSQKARMELRAGMTQGTPPSPEMREKQQALQADEQKAIKAVLTKEQNEVYDKNMAAMRERMGRRGNG